MHFHVRMEIPTNMPSAVADEIKAREKVSSQELRRSGKWRHIWPPRRRVHELLHFRCREQHRVAQDPDRAAPVSVHDDHGDVRCRHPSSVRDRDS